MANFPMNMEYPAEFLRGWPVDGGLELSYPIKAAEELSVGMTVKTNASGEVQATTGTTPTGFGIVVRGNVDDKSVAASNKAIVLWGHYIVKLSKDLCTGGVTTGIAVGERVGAAADGLWSEQATGEGLVLEANTDYIIVSVK